jgi:outer membrane receptor protein involved in Fe transport
VHHEAELFHAYQASDEGDLLDPTAHYADPLNLSRGNPDLKPEYIRALELGLQRTGERVTVQVTPFWRHTVDAVRSIRTIDAAGVATRTYANIATADAYGGDATIALGGGRLTGFAGASAFHQVSNAANITPGLSINAWAGGRANARCILEDPGRPRACVVSAGDDGRTRANVQPDAGQPRRPKEADG